MATFVTHKAFLWSRLKRTKRSPLSHPSSPIVAHWGRAAHDNWETSQCGCTCADKRSDWPVGWYSMKTGTCRSNTDLSLFSLKDHLCKRRDFNHSGTPRIPGCIGGWDGLEEKNYENTLWFFFINSKGFKKYSDIFLANAQLTMSGWSSEWDVPPGEIGKRRDW